MINSEKDNENTKYIIEYTWLAHVELQDEEQRVLWALQRQEAILSKYSDIIKTIPYGTDSGKHFSIQTNVKKKIHIIFLPLSEEL